jgi:FMN-dependent NADH-azoreductase
VARILHIAASPRDESYSRRLAEAFLDACRQARPEDRIETLDLFEADIPPFHAPEAAGKYSVMAGQTPQGEAGAAWKRVIETIEHFKRFDKFVVSSPMWNFGVPYRLKQYIDVIVQPSLTFAASAKGFSGLVTGRPMMLLMARGGVYRSGNPLESLDFQESYLRTIFGFIGFTDIRSVTIQGTLKNKPEQVEADLREAIGAARKIASDFATRVAQRA